MIRLFSFLILMMAFSFEIVAQAENGAQTCPNMNGHFIHRQFLATVDATVVQAACDTMNLHVLANVLGSRYDEAAESPIDGVTRTITTQQPGERDDVSARFVGDTVVFILDRYVTNSSSGNTTHSKNMIAMTLTSPDVLHLELSDMDDQGHLSNIKKFDFQRAP